MRGGGVQVDGAGDALELHLPKIREGELGSLG
jgi:hypothetical protein